MGNLQLLPVEVLVPPVLLLGPDPFELQLHLVLELDDHLLCSCLLLLELLGILLRPV